MLECVKKGLLITKPNGMLVCARRRHADCGLTWHCSLLTREHVHAVHQIQVKIGLVAERDLYGVRGILGRYVQHHATHMGGQFKSRSDWYMDGTCVKPVNPALATVSA